MAGVKARRAARRGGESIKVSLHGALDFINSLVISGLEEMIKIKRVRVGGDYKRTLFSLSSWES